MTTTLPLHTIYLAYITIYHTGYLAYLDISVHSGCRLSSFISSLTLFPSLPTSGLLPTPLPHYLHISTGQHLIIPTLMYSMMPNLVLLTLTYFLCSRRTHHCSHTLITPKSCTKHHSRLSILQRHSTHPPHHHMLRLSPDYAYFNVQYSTVIHKKWYPSKSRINT